MIKPDPWSPFVGRRVGVPPPLSFLSVLLGLLSVAALLAWVNRRGSFALWFWGVSAPSMALLGLIGVVVHRRWRYSRLAVALRAGVLGGIAGTLACDLFRVPFAALGPRLFAPIGSYGVLLLGARSSSPWTGLAGWSYHLLNGIGFGVAFAILALGRRWWWGVAWGMVLETATIPYSWEHGLAGHWRLIGLAYLAHVAYGASLGTIVERARSRPGQRRDHGSEHSDVAPHRPRGMVVAVAPSLRCPTPAGSSHGSRARDVHRAGKAPPHASREA